MTRSLSSTDRKRGNHRAYIAIGGRAGRLAIDTPPDFDPTDLSREGQARAVLRGHAGDGLETWLADQRWRAALDGSWLVEPERDGCTYRVEGVPGCPSVRVVERRPSAAGAVTSWLIV